LVKKHNISYQKVGSLVVAESSNALYLRSEEYMNLSGKELKKFRKISPELSSKDFFKENLYVSQDFLDLEVGKWKIKHYGSANGQNGIKSIIKELGNFDEFKRICIGIGRPNSKDSEIVAKYVLSPMNRNDFEIYHDKVFPEIHKYLTEN